MNKPLNKAFSIAEIGVILLIISILFAAITEGTNLYRKSKLASARNLTQNSPVIYYEDLALWLETTRLDSFDDETPGNGDAIENWHSVLPTANPNDKFTVTQGTLANRPIYDSVGINGKPALQFNGTSQYLSRTSTYLSDVASTSEHSVFAVVVNTPSSESTIYTLILGTDIFRMHATENTTFFYDFGSGVAAGGRSSFDPSNFDGVPHIISVVKNSAGASAKFNGQSITFASTAPTDINNTSASEFFIGKNEGTQYHAGHIGEVIMFKSALDSDQVVAIEEYLSSKWDIPLK